MSEPTMMRALVRLLSLILGALSLSHPAAVADPEVQVLVPGFEVRALPVSLTNVNSLAFAPDGRLFALGYNGRIWRLSDTDRDGLEDRAEVFWDKPRFQVPIGLLWAPEGLYVSSHGKVSLIHDDDRDGRGDWEEVVASGWPPTDVPSGGVDALGLARDRAGNLYFGLGTADYTNAYRIKDGRSRYDLRSERGAIIKLSADRKRREVIATGIRFPYALRFNRLGDLFATDQEGETWLPGGNPLDELNQVVPGRHYGFPPRHETHLPDVVDEPPVVEFGPQHQSACGLAFDEASPGRRLFGPASWDGDAFVAGFSRGKVWRVALVKTAHGYVGRPTLFATADMLAVDAAISPGGHLYLSGHSGEPDWGSGPEGRGRIVQVRYSDPGAPQPVVAWPAGPLEARVAFDRPVDPALLEGLAGQTLAFGEFVRAADRYEVHRPGYKAVKAQQAAPKGTLRIAAARLSDEGRTLALTTDPHPWPVTYALSVPTVKAPGQPGPGATIDLAYDLTGVEATWSRDANQDGAQSPAWSGWWPHLDTAVARALTAGSAGHARGFAHLAEPGRLTLRTLLTLPEGRATLTVDASGPFEVTLGLEEPAASRPGPGGRHKAEVATDSTAEALEVALSAPTGAGGRPWEVHASFHTEQDPTERPLPIGRLALPWAPGRPPASAPAPELPANLAGGDPNRGEAVFFSEQAKCASCHTIRGRGGTIGPDLTNLVHRDAASVYRDINDPSATVNPDFVSHTVALKSGQVATGVVRAEGPDAIRVSDTNARQTIIRRSDIEDLRPSSSSVMPAGLVGSLGEAKVRDLLAFLLTPPEAPKAEDQKTDK